VKTKTSPHSPQEIDWWPILWVRSTCY
jgi:hypothetical protein